MHSPELLKGTLQTIVLKVLKDHGKMYGYEITQRVKELAERYEIPMPQQVKHVAELELKVNRHLERMGFKP